MARHLHDPVSDRWEDLPPTAPLWRVRILTPAVLLLAVVAGTWWAVGWLTSPAGPTGPGAPEAAAVGTAAPEESRAAGDARAPDGSSSGPVPSAAHDVGPPGIAPAVTVHVVGEVAEPGLVELPPGARVQDALEAAGGPTGDAVVAALNLAAPVQDGIQIMVPGPGETVEPVVGGPGTGAGPAGAGAGASGAVDVNTADAAGLEALPGIGPALAARIIDHRERVGPFTSMEDLDAVSGIGPAMMERLDGLVSW